MYTQESLILSLWQAPALKSLGAGPPVFVLSWMPVGIDWAALTGVFSAFALWFALRYFSRHRPFPHLPFSSLQLFPEKRSRKLVMYSYLPTLNFAALAFFLLAALNPRLFLEQKNQEGGSSHPAAPAVEGMAIYLALDQSGSMAGIAQSDSSRRAEESKLAVLKTLTRSFIEGDASKGLKGRPGDMIGLVAFARTAQVLSPLTLDHRQLIDELQKLDIMRTQDQDGTGIGYAIYKTAHLLSATRHFAETLKSRGKAAYEIKDSAIILVTDGMQDPNPLDESHRYRWMDPEQAAMFAKNQKIKLYVINIDPQFSKPEWEANRKQMQRVAEKTGGRFYSLNTASSLAEIYKEIDQLEKSRFFTPLELSSEEKQEPSQIYTTVWLYPYFIGCGMLLLLVSLLLQTTWLRVIP